MESDFGEFRQSIIAAVQAELERHAAAVVAEVDLLRDEWRSGLVRMRSDFSEQVKAAASLADQSAGRLDENLRQSTESNDQRIKALESHLVNELNEITSGLEGLIRSMVKPFVTDVQSDLDKLAQQVRGLDVNLRKFDEQAARMVTYFNDVTRVIDKRQEEMSSQVQADVASQIKVLKRAVDENGVVVRKLQSEVPQSMSKRIGDAVDLFNDRLLVTETRLQEDAGQKIAAIDAHVGRVASSIDETMLIINNRMALFDGEFAVIDERINEVLKATSAMTEDVVDDLREKISGAIGEAVLVKIDLERFEKVVNAKSDQLVVRVAEVEARIADVTMDVSIAVQLDRLEEIERALIELDPAKYVLKDDTVRTGGVPIVAVPSDVQNDGN